MENTKKIGENLYLVEVEPTVVEQNTGHYAEMLAKIQQKDDLLGKVKEVLQGAYVASRQNLLEVENKAPAPAKENEFKSGFWFGIFVTLIVLYLIALITTALNQEKAN